MAANLSNPRILVGTIIVLSLALVGATVFTVFGQDDVIIACVNDQNGNTRIVESENDCRNRERVVQWNQQGQAGPEGPQGPPGPVGPAGVSGYEIVSIDHTLAPGGFVRDTAICPTGKVVIGGGAQVINEGSQNFHMKLHESTPGTIGGGTNSVWLVAIENQDTLSHTIRISAICAFAG
jgi:hypothetical protein